MSYSRLVEAARFFMTSRYADAASSAPPEASPAS